MIKKASYFLIFLLLTFKSNYAQLDSKDNKLIIQSTTSTRDSGFYDYILPYFNKKYDSKVYVIAGGTGLAIKNAIKCNADILIVHAFELEQKFITDGYGIKRDNLMYNDFIVIGPKNDPAKISELTSIIDVFKNIKSSNTKFISRGDDSGTNIVEKKIWDETKISLISNNWYFKTGQGMGATLNIAIGKNAYTFVDRSTWIGYSNKQNHKILYENDPLLFNQYAIIKMNHKYCPNVNKLLADKFYLWMISKEAKNLIRNYKISNQQLFYINE